ncbi:MAG: accessory Sec system glycosyltransferase GtfA [Pseudobutyrivibrio sp.]|nr:accessory Sec system glycosyltransferase GtfA [Pseudobutyrivibrio sp.]
MIYNFNLGIGWASSGVEYAQIYRAKLFRRLGFDAKFIFTDMFPTENLEHFTSNIGFEDSEIIWLYTFFTDQKISPVTYTLSDLEKSFDRIPLKKTRDKKTVKYIFEGKDNFYTCYMVDETSDRVHRVEYVSSGLLVRKDYFTYVRSYSEYYAPLDNKAHMYHRRFFNEDGSLAYEEINDDGNVTYRFKDRILCGKEQLVAYMVKCLGLTDNDTIIIDRTTDVGQAILMNAGDARVGVVIHADHYSEGATDQDYILWNNYYEYPFSQYKHIDFYIASTDAQRELLNYQFEKYLGVKPNVVTIPVGSIDERIYPDRERKNHSLITASRLADEKHIDWIISAVVGAKEAVPDLTLDIYGKGANEKSLKKLIADSQAESYIRLMGQHDLKNIYKDYQAYIAGSMSEGFGLTLMEAVGSGLPIIGFDVPYGNPTFVDQDKNGYLIPVNAKMDGRQKVEELKKAIVKLFTEANLEEFSRHSYDVAADYLTDEVMNKWKALIEK